MRHVPGGLTSPPAAGSAQDAHEPFKVRVDSIDLVRGVIMILMALDHVRDYFGAAGVDPTDPATTTGALFFTRWITHICAPVFFLLTGVSAFLVSQRRSTRDLSRYLLTRGLWLILLEVTVMRCLAWQFNFDYQVTMLTVLWALGASMVLLSGLVWLPVGAVGAVAVTVIAGHNLLDRLPASALGSLAPLVAMLHAPSVVFSNGTHVVFSAYPLVPWVAVVAAGYALGPVFLWKSGRRQAFLVRLGLTLTIAYVLLRIANVYGDPRPWMAHDSVFRSALAFLATTKYPPSLLFLLMTLGPAMLVLAAVERKTPAWLRPAVTFGRVPLFYFVLHAVVIHVFAVIVCYLRYGDAHWMFESPTLAQFPVTQPPGWPVGLPGVYLVWLCVVATLFPLCRWFAEFKRRRREWWLSYM